ncbi:MAG: MBL fold metallo-hydrolase [Lachnospiraceae bacterium]|nr:MBL fold metallo-hydrolase [Lachnospiraceae bacterium]
MSNFEITFLGTNGSIAYNHGGRVKYGTNSICAVVKAGNDTLIFDAGTGLPGIAKIETGHEINIFLSHYHTDHISGLLFYPAFFDPQKTISFYGLGDVEAIIDDFLSPPLHPINLKLFNAALEFNSVSSGDVMHISEDVSVKAYQVSHPGGALAYRVEYDGKSLCYLTDCELSNHQDDEGLLSFAKGVDLLVFDAFFDDGKVIKGWGHPSFTECAEWAKKAEVKRLSLFHHEFKLTDAEIDEREAKAKEIFPETFTAADFMTVII